MITVRKQELVNIMMFCISIRQSAGQIIHINLRMLEKALSHSLAIYLALDGDAVVGLVRLVGDGFFIGFLFRI